MQVLSLREVALWYPKVPEPDLCLNEESFTGENPLSTGYRPLFWTHFGGPGGTYLDHVTGMSVKYLGGLYSLEFHYDTTSRPAGTDRLGRFKEDGYSRSLEFSIDGPGGELIELVEFSLQRWDANKPYGFLNHGILEFIKVRNSSFLETTVIF